MQNLPPKQIQQPEGDHLPHQAEASGTLSRVVRLRQAQRRVPGGHFAGRPPSNGNSRRVRTASVRNLRSTLPEAREDKVKVELLL